MSEPTPGTKSTSPKGPVEAGPVERLVMALREPQYLPTFKITDALDALAPPCGTCRGRGVSTPGGYDDLPPASPCPACSGSGRDMSRVRLADAAIEAAEDGYVPPGPDPQTVDQSWLAGITNTGTQSVPARSALQEVNP